jgi:hypothetical protein
MVDVNKLQELNPSIVQSQYGKKEGLTEQEKTVVVAFQQVTILSSARTAVCFELTLAAARMMNMSSETIEILEAVVGICRDSLTEPQAKDIYDKAMLVALSDSSVNLMHTALAFHLKKLREAKELELGENQPSLAFDP